MNYCFLFKYITFVKPIFLFVNLPLDLSCLGYFFRHELIKFSCCASLLGDSCVYVAGFGAVNESCGVVKESHGCKDVFVSESHLTLAFPERLESWDLQKEEKTPSWSMELKTESAGIPQTFVVSFLVGFKLISLKYMLFIFRLSFESAPGAWRLHRHKSPSLSTVIPTFESQEYSSECRTCNSSQCHWSCVLLGTGQVGFILTSLGCDSNIILTFVGNICHFKSWSVRAWSSNI